MTCSGCNSWGWSQIPTDLSVGNGKAPLGPIPSRGIPVFTVLQFRSWSGGLRHLGTAPSAFRPCMVGQYDLIEFGLTVLAFYPAVTTSRNTGKPGGNLRRPQNGSRGCEYRTEACVLTLQRGDSCWGRRDTPVVTQPLPSVAQWERGVRALLWLEPRLSVPRGGKRPGTRPGGGARCLPSPGVPPFPRPRSCAQTDPRGTAQRGRSVTPALAPRCHLLPAGLPCSRGAGPLSWAPATAPSFPGAPTAGSGSCGTWGPVGGRGWCRSPQGAVPVAGRRAVSRSSPWRGPCVRVAGGVSSLAACCGCEGSAFSCIHTRYKELWCARGGIWVFPLPPAI